MNNAENYSNLGQAVAFWKDILVMLFVGIIENLP